ncbi:hypothetical protein D5F01_LYC11217 [Larimichthys crocea]|uniref:Uncharacterized protein n=1 Tax=Larimichthys crocea TaxID=215358 RepID=A0A6G0IDE5_LARCR|nr:hypothetical protein D5F01_LYC11217 [Larimichthys crocea]
MAEAAPGAGPQSPGDPGVKGDPPDIDNGASEKQVKPRIPHRIILYGEGLQSWSPAVYDYFMKHMDGREPSEVEDEILEAMAGNGATSKSSGLTRQVAMLHNKGALLRATSREDDRRSIPDEPPEGSLASDQDGSTAGRQGSASDSDDPEEHPRKESAAESESDAGLSSNEDPATGLKKTSDEEEGGGDDRSLTPEENLNLPSTLNRDATPSIKRLLKKSELQRKRLALQGVLLRRMANYQPQPQTSAPKKRKEKQKHLLPPTDSESEEVEGGNDERLRPLNRLPDEVRRIPGQGRLGVYQWIGSPWQIDGDALLVFTDINLKIYNATFRRDLGPHVQSMRTHKKGAYVLFHAHVQMYQT